MGIAAYNRGSRRISIEIQRGSGQYSGDYAKRKPTQRPENWGGKALNRAIERAESVLESNRRCGRNVTFDDLVDIIVDRERVGRETATTAAKIATSKVIT
jgi:hypothetical protein